MAVLCTSVKQSGTNGWNISVCMMKFIYATVKEKLTLSARNGIHAIKFCVDSAFDIHLDFKSHAGAVMKIKDRKEVVTCQSLKQKLNTGRSTMAELVEGYDALPLILWKPIFLE